MASIDPSELEPAKYGKPHDAATLKRIKAGLRKEGRYADYDTGQKNTKRPRKVQDAIDDAGLVARRVPLEIPDWQLLLMCEGKLCGARTPLGFCLRPPTAMEHRTEAAKKRVVCRCAMHGGSPNQKSGGVPKRRKVRLKPKNRTEHPGDGTVEKIVVEPVQGNTRGAAQVGWYTECLLPGEENMYREVTVDEMDDEIRMLKIRLVRLQKAQARVEDAILEFDPAERRRKMNELWICFERTEEKEYVGNTVTSRKIRAAKRIPDFHAKINTLQAELSKAIRVRFDILRAQGGGETPEERAAQAREYLEQILNTHSLEGTSGAGTEESG